MTSLVGISSREISLTNGQQPMEIFSGNYEGSSKAPLSEWSRYPYKATTNRESFSQALFRIMEIPEVSSDLSGHITVHQILRLLYADQLRSSNEALRAQQEVRLSTAYANIAEEVLDLLRRDLRRQDIFEDPQKVTFTFGDNSIFVDDESYFSASSRAILKSSFYLGFLAAATKHNFFRHPRFCMIDTHENMGVEAIRSQNFQLQALRISKESNVEHQIIYATAMIEPELEDEAYTVGAFSTNDERTIAIKM